MDVSTIVVDSGAYAIKAGNAGLDRPSCILPTIVGRLKPKSSLPPDMPVKDYYVGAEVYTNSIHMSLRSPITDRVIIQLDDMELLWGHVFEHEMGIDTKEHPILMTEPPHNPNSVKEGTTQIMMEKFGVPAFYMTHPGVLSLVGIGKSSGIVVDSGETMTNVLPVYEFYGMTHVDMTLDIGGRQITNQLKRNLSQNGINFSPSTEKEALRTIKETMCYVATDYESELLKGENSPTLDKIFTTPEGNDLSIGAERYKSPELFFDPKLIGLQSTGLSGMLKKSYESIDEDIRSKVSANVVLIGGSSQFPGLSDRLKADIDKNIGVDAKINVITPPNIQNAAWYGGSRLASLATFSQMWITQSEYNETGPSIVRLKCF